MRRVPPRKARIVADQVKGMRATRAMSLLHFLPNKTARVTTTVSGILVDVRTGFVYGVVEASHSSSHLASSWSEEQAVDKARLETERESFAKFVESTATTWKAMLKDHAATLAPTTQPR